MNKIFKKWFSGTSGATAIEYGIIVAGVALGISAIVFVMGDQLTALFQTLAASFD